MSDASSIRTKKQLNYYHVEITDGTGLIRGANEFSMTVLDVIGENARNLVVNDLQFTTVSKEKADYRISLDRPEISACAKDSVWGSRIAYYLYTEKHKRAATIRKEIDAFVQEKFGFFLKGLDLSIIKD